MHRGVWKNWNLPSARPEVPGGNKSRAPFYSRCMQHYSSGGVAISRHFLSLSLIKNNSRSRRWAGGQLVRASGSKCTRRREGHQLTSPTTLEARSEKACWDRVDRASAVPLRTPNDSVLLARSPLAPQSTHTKKHSQQFNKHGRVSVRIGLFAAAATCSRAFDFLPAWLRHADASSASPLDAAAGESLPPVLLFMGNYELAFNSPRSGT
jgi:hypothetical protein